MYVFYIRHNSNIRACMGFNLHILHYGDKHCILHNVYAYSLAFVKSIKCGYAKRKIIFYSCGTIACYFIFFYTLKFIVLQLYIFLLESILIVNGEMSLPADIDI